MSPIMAYIHITGTRNSGSSRGIPYSSSTFYNRTSDSSYNGIGMGDTKNFMSLYHESIITILAIITSCEQRIKYFTDVKCL